MQAPHIVAPALFKLKPKRWTLDSRTSLNGNSIVEFPACILEDACMLSINKSITGGRFKIAEVESFTLGNNYYYDMQVCLDSCVGFTESTDQ